MKQNTKKHSTYLSHDESEAHVHSDSSHYNMDHNHGHDHSDMFRQQSGRVLFWCLIITLSFSIIEGVAGWWIGSIALESDAVHMLTDAAGLMIAYFANRISQKPANVNLSFGYGKAEVLGAWVNCLFTTILTAGLLFEVVMRFLEPVEIQGAPLFIVATIGLFINGIVVYILSKNSHSLNTRAALIHALGDLLGSLVAIIAGAVIYFTGWSMIDPILSLIVIAILISSNYRIIKKSSIILMAGVPEHLDYESVGHDLKAIKGVVAVHDLHIWYISANESALAAHVIACKPEEWPELLTDCQKMLWETHKIGHITLQPEFDSQKCKQIGCCD